MITSNIAKVVVLNPAGQVLLLRRSKADRRRPGDWDFPGGSVEENESFAEAAAREVGEETGLRTEPTELRLLYMATDYWQPDDMNHNRCLYKLQLAADDAITLSNEHDSYQWTDVETALAEFKHHFYNTGLRYAHEHHLL